MDHSRKQNKKATEYCTILITCNYRADETNVDRKHISSGVRLTTKEYKATFGGNDNVLYIGVVVT